MKPILRITLLFFLLPNILFPQLNWTRHLTIPQENTINDMCKIPGTGLIIAVCDNATFMFSDDEGNSWYVQSNPAGINNETNLYVVYFQDSQKGIILAGYETILSTSDGGINWAVVYSGSTIYPWATYNDIAMNGSDIGVAVGYEGNVLRTINGGNSWYSVTSGVDFKLNAIDFCSDNKVIAVGQNHNQILVSTNAGEAWSSQPIIPPIAGGNLKDIHFTDSTVGFISVDNGSSSLILRTVNEGNNWVSVWSEYGYYPNKIDFFDELNGSISCGQNIYESGLLSTNNGGLTWDENPIGQFSWLAHNGLVMINQEEILIGGNLGMIFKSQTGGTDWQTIHNRTFWGSIFQVQFTDTLIGYTLASNQTGGVSSHGLFKTENGGLSWNPVGGGETYYEATFYFINNDTGFYVVNDFSLNVYKSTNGGLSWVLLETDNFDFYPTCVSFYNETLGFICGTNDIIRTQNGGLTWELVYQGVFTDDHWDIYFKSENEILVSGSFLYETYLLKSQDGGDTWEFTVNLPNFGHAFDIEFIDAATGFMACENNMILKTTNGGNNWNETTVNAAEGTLITKIQFFPNGKGYASAIGPYATFFETDDYGSTWNPVSTPSTSGILDFHFFNEETGMAFGENGLVLKTGEFLELNPPQNLVLYQEYIYPPGWNIFYLNWGAPSPINAPELTGYNIYRCDDFLAFRPEDGFNPASYVDTIPPSGPPGNCWNVCYYVTAVYDNPTGESAPSNEECKWYLTDIDEAMGIVNKAICSPNPFRNTTEVSFSSPISERGELLIFDQAGKCLLQIPFERETTKIHIPGKNLDTGIYFFQIRTDRGILVTNKMIKL